jgi:hypothetical protein
MLFALGAASSAMEAIQSLLPSSSVPSTGSAGSKPFALSESSPASASSVAASGTSAPSQLSPSTMDALLAAQSQSSTGSPSQTSTNPASTGQNVSSPIDGEDGEISAPTGSGGSSYSDPSTTSSPAAAPSPAATSSYNSVAQMVQHQLNAISFSAAPLLSFSA